MSSKGSTFGRAEAKEPDRTWTEEERTVGLKAFGRGYAGWGFSQAFYREKLHEKSYNAKDLGKSCIILGSGEIVARHVVEKDSKSCLDRRS